MPGGHTVICTFTADEMASIKRMAQASGKRFGFRLVESVMREIIADEQQDHAAERRESVG